MKVLDNSDTEIEAFDAVCVRLGGFNLRVSGEWADGYLTALAAGPRAVPIDEWLPRMAGDAFERAFADPEDVAQARQALAARVRVLAHHLDPEALLDDIETLRLHPLASDWDEPAPEPQAEQQAQPHAANGLSTGSLWAEGFFAALDDFADDWQRPHFAAPDACEAFDELLLHVKVLRLPDGEAHDVHLQRFWKGACPTRGELLDEACFAIQELRVWWIDHAPRPATRRVQVQPGRNDPCPCGSGLKFKKCHGKSA